MKAAMVRYFTFGYQIRRLEHRSQYDHFFAGTACFGAGICSAGGHAGTA